MKKIVFYLNIITVIFVIGRDISSFSGDKSIYTLFSLLYLLLIIIPEIINKPIISSLIVILSIVLILPLKNNILPYLIPFHIIQVLKYLKGRYFYISLLIFLIPLIFISQETYYQYLLISLLLITLYINLSLYSVKYENIKKIISKLETENSQFSKKLIRYRDYDIERDYQLKLEERSKFAQKLHDDIGHTISGSIFQLEAIKVLFDSDKKRALKMVDNVSEALNNGINSIRESLKIIKPSNQDIGLQNIKKVLKEFELINDIKIIKKVSGDQSCITSRVWLIILSNTKEALTNVLKYSHATEVKFEIEIFNQIIKVLIHDNGVGVKLVKANMGINGMEDRMSDIDGTLIVDGSNGFSITMLFKR